MGTDSIRLKRLERLAFQRTSQMVLFELADPRLTMVSITRVELTADLGHATVYWSVIGNDAARSKVSHALADATSQVQSGIAKVFHTRRSPRVRWKFDESIEGAIRVSRLLDDLREERGDDDEDAPETPDAAVTPES